MIVVRVRKDVALLRERETKPDANTLFFKCAIEKSTKTMTEAQEKNHTDPINLSSRTPLDQLMRRAVTYTHQAGADGSNAPLP